MNPARAGNRSTQVSFKTSGLLCPLRKSSAFFILYPRCYDLHSLNCDPLHFLTPSLSLDPNQRYRLIITYNLMYVPHYTFTHTEAPRPNTFIPIQHAAPPLHLPLSFREQQIQQRRNLHTLERLCSFFCALRINLNQRPPEVFGF